MSISMTLYFSGNGPQQPSTPPPQATPANAQPPANAAAIREVLPVLV
jgi:hypothetical protein